MVFRKKLTETVCFRFIFDFDMVNKPKIPRIPIPKSLKQYSNE